MKAPVRGALRSAILVALIGCQPAVVSREIDHDLIDVSPDAKLRTDTVGAGQWEDHSTFVLVDAKNRATEGAYITLSGELADGSGTVVGELRAQSLWIPAGEVRTFALIDRERKPRPTAAAARIHVRGAQVPVSPPTSYVDGIHERVDNGRIVVQGTLHNDAARPAQIMVIAIAVSSSASPPSWEMLRLIAGASHAASPALVGPSNMPRSGPAHSR